MQQLPGQMSIFDLDMPCGKMFPEHSAATKEKILGSSSKNSAKLQTKQPMFLDLRKENGTLVGASWGMGIPSRGECLMRDFGESPSEEEESGLSQILEANVPLKYYLSARACEGVLRRAKKRGKELPEILEEALKQQIERWRKYGSPLPVFGEETEICVIYDEENITSKVNASNPQIGDPCHTLGRTGAGRTLLCQCYDARGNGDGKVVPTITGDHNSRIRDYTAVVCETVGFNHLNGSKAASNAASNAETLNGSPTLRSNSPTSVVIAYCYSQDAYDKYINSKISSALRASGGNLGGGSETLVCAGFHPQAGKSAGISFKAEESPTLQVHKDAAVCYCLQGNGIDRADTAGCNGKGVKKGESYTLNTIDRHAVCCEEKTFYVVRRLTPLECCRLQGMPDFWTDGVEGSDAARYKLWGNGMALPNALYIMEGF